jgi:PhnB protein
VHLYVEDADAVVKKATAAGATVIDPVADKFYGDRSGSIVDPWGHLWAIATHVEDVSPEEIQKRLAAMAKK